MASREERARYGANVEMRPSVMRGPGGPALRESAFALLEALDVCEPLSKIAEHCSAYAAADQGARRAARAARLAQSLAYELFGGGEDPPLVLDFRRSNDLCPSDLRSSPSGRERRRGASRVPYRRQRTSA